MLKSPLFLALVVTSSLAVWIRPASRLSADELSIVCAKDAAPLEKLAGRRGRITRPTATR